MIQTMLFIQNYYRQIFSNDKITFIFTATFTVEAIQILLQRSHHGIKEHPPQNHCQLGLTALADHQ